MENCSFSFIDHLDQEIMKTRDLCDLNNLLIIKISTSKLLNSKQKINCDLSFVLTEDLAKFDIIFEILVKAFQVCENTLQLLKATASYIEANHSNIKYKCNITRLFKYLLSFFGRGVKTELLFEHIKAELICKFLISELNNVVNKAESYETLISYFDVFPKHQQIYCINTVFQTGREHNDLNIVCALVNSSSEIVLFDDASCFTNENTWSYVASCISSRESHLQKQGGYILSKCANSPVGINKVKYFNCPNRDISWQAFFILVDIGREKQLHLVEPSLNLFKHVYDLPLIWQKCVYEIYLHHTQSLIVYHIAIHVLKQSYVGETLKEIIALIFQAINKNEYNSLSCKMFNTLGAFCASLHTTDLEIVFSEFVMVPWNVVSFWKTIRSVLANKNRTDIPASLCQELITCALNLPHIYIRNECVQFLVTVLWNEQDFDKVYKIVYSLTLNNVDNLVNFHNCKITKSVADTAIDNIVKCNGQIVNFHKPYTLFTIAALQHSNTLKALQNKTKLNPDFTLLACNFGLKHHQNKREFDEAPGDVQDFTIAYFKNHLREETAEVFIQLCAKSSLRAKTIFDIFENPQHFNNTQLYVALVLIKQFLFDVNFNIDIQLKIVENSFNILIIKANHETVIKSNDWKVCKASLDLICNENKISYLETRNVIEIFQHLLNSHSNSVLSKLYEKVYDSLFLTEAPKLIIDFTTVLRKNLFQIKKDQYYKDIVRQFIRIVYSEMYIRFSADGFDSITNDMVILSELCPFVRFTLIKQINQLCLVNSKYHPACLRAVADIYYQGAVISNDERTHFYMCQEVFEEQGSNAPFDLDNCSNPNLQSTASRLLALKNLLLIGKTDPDLILDTLEDRYMLYFKKRYFPGSKIYYEKLRILQAVLLLVSETRLSEDLIQRISCFIFNILQEESNQNCIKQILNCILIFLLRDVSLVIKWIKSSSNITPVVLLSVISAIYHLTLLGNENTLQEVTELLLPWTMGSQLKSRVYSQDCVKRLIEHGKKMNYVAFLAKYDYLTDCINSVLGGSSEILINTLATDLIILKYLNPRERLSWIGVLYDIPRLNKVCPAEWQNVQYVMINLDFPSLLENVAFSDAVDEFLSNEVIDTEEPIGKVNGMLQLQAKIVPWKAGLGQHITEVESDFILVASLIDKAQNLGGLSRTSEVFGIRDIVFNNIKITDEKEFKSLSMSSESWINRIEVKVKDLREYLLKLKHAGYNVIGAEQTVGSQRLDMFHFPRKVALVLGNEKTGIPPDIIPLLNYCLEIPQLGQTRSLNVHVAGATFIWEYAKQHLVKRPCESLSN